MATLTKVPHANALLGLLYSRIGVQGRADAVMHPSSPCDVRLHTISSVITFFTVSFSYVHVDELYQHGSRYHFSTVYMVSGCDTPHRRYLVMSTLTYTMYTTP